MSDVKHTPGPWAAERDKLGVQRFYIRGDRERYVGSIGNGTNSKDNPAEANAHLVAAAPDLLAACEELLSLWPLSGYELEAFCAATVVPLMRSAVAKAKGHVA